MERTTFKLTDAEHRAIGQHSKRHGFIGVVEWMGNYRPMRTESHPTGIEAQRALVALMASRRAAPGAAQVFRVDRNGKVLGKYEGPTTPLADFDAHVTAAFAARA